MAIAVKKTGSGLAEYAKSKVGCPYWYGTRGQIATQQLLDARAKMYSDWYMTSRMPRLKAQLGKQVYDCAGLIEGYINDHDGDGIDNDGGMYDTTANLMYCSCITKGTITTMPDTQGVLVFMDGHVGVYVGNGDVIEARGFDYGVCKTKLKDRPWKNWGMHLMIDYGKVDAPAQTTSTSMPTGAPRPTLKKGSKGDEVRELQTLLYADGSFGAETEGKVKEFQKLNNLAQDGVVGPRTWAALLK